MSDRYQRYFSTSQTLAELLGPATGSKIKWPVICVCQVCHGVSSLFHKGRAIQDKQLALRVALMQEGYHLAHSESAKYSQSYNPHFACECTCDHHWTSVTIGKCLHRDTCSRCGLVVQRDSSD